MHHHRTAAWLLGALALALAGCGSGGGHRDGGGDALAAKAPHWLKIFMVAGPDGAYETAAQQQGVENGARLALDQWAHTVSYGRGARKHSFHIYLTPLEDSTPKSGAWSQGLTAANAQRAASARNAVAYIGDFDSAATALTLPALSGSGILEVSPWSPYVGFTDSDPADDEGDPARYYPQSGQRDFARLIPSDVAEASAIAELMQQQGVRRLYVLGDVSVFDSAVAQLVANDAQSHGITLVGFTQGIDTQTNSQPVGYVQYAASAAAARPDAVLLGGTAGLGAVALWRELHTMLPHALLFAPSTLATPAFLAAIAAPGGRCVGASRTPVTCSAAASATYVTSPILEPNQYPQTARAVFRAYRRRFHTRTAPVYALYGYAAMEDVLQAIRLTGRQIGNHAVLLRDFFHRLGMIHGVIGDYTIDGNGDSSLQTFDGYRVAAGGTLRLLTEISAG